MIIGVGPDQRLSLTSHEKEILHDQVIDENGPGTILRDFETLLHIVEPGDIRASGKLGLLPLELLPQINGQLTRPIQIDLQRPQQKSYPHINGLYLLLRGICLLLVDQTGSKNRLRLDSELLRSWRNLNATERYFTLFETWLFHADPKILGELGFVDQPPIMRLSRFFRNIPRKGFRVEEGEKGREELKYSPAFHNLGLLDLFGMIEVEDVSPEPGKGWHIARIHGTAFGGALLKLTYRSCHAAGFKMPTVNLGPPTFGELQPTMKPYFPEWHGNLVIPEPVFHDGIYVFKVSLGRIWRRIALPAKLTLKDLSYCIMGAFDFDDDHLYRFSFRNHRGSMVHVYDPRADSGGLYADEVSVGELPLKPGTSMTYLYDFGDEWEFKVKTERIDPPDDSIRRPVVLKTHGEAPEQYPVWDESDEEDE